MFQSVEPGEVKHAAATSGPATVVPDPPSSEKEIDPSSIPTAIKYQDDNSLAHPNVRSLDLKNVHWSLLDWNEFKLLSFCADDKKTVGGNGFIYSYLLEIGSWPPSLRAVTWIWIWCYPNHVVWLLEVVFLCLTKIGKKKRLVGFLNLALKDLILPQLSLVHWTEPVTDIVFYYLLWSRVIPLCLWEKA